MTSKKDNLLVTDGCSNQSGPSSCSYPQGRYLNRELSWLEFNKRVLEEASDPRNPLLERLNFFCIASSNLDEFFEIRVAGIKQQIEARATLIYPDGLTPSECLEAIRKEVRLIIQRQDACWAELHQLLSQEGVRILRPEQLSQSELCTLRQRFYQEIEPVLSPIALDPAHPCPLIPHKVLCLLILGRFPASLKETRKRRRWALLTLPRSLPRLIELTADQKEDRYVLLCDIVRWFLPEILPGVQILGSWFFRVTRNSELYVKEDDQESLLEAVEREIRRRLRGAVVRVETESGIPEMAKARLAQLTGVDPLDIYELNSPLEPEGLRKLYRPERFPTLCFRSFVAPESPRLKGREDIFAAIREADILLHHPYENFDSVLRLLQQASRDPDVIAIKQTLYRTGGDPAIIKPLKEASQTGKHVTVVVELKARFEEEENVRWARELQEVGAQVIYGVLGFKVHCKMLLIVRREQDGIRRYLHLSTGNYNPKTSQQYADLGLLTCNPQFGAEAARLFNVMTGLCSYRPGSILMVAPFTLHTRMIELIRREIKHAKEGLPARIIAKVNALVEPTLIDALYEASQAGVQIDLIVRGICCLRPGVKGLSENINVRSIVGRFLEHARIFYFHNAGQPEVYIGSADWMPRNFFYRIETVFPIFDGLLKERIVHQILHLQLRDNFRARILQPDGTYLRLHPKEGEPIIDSQEELLKAALESAKTLPAIAKPATSPAGLNP